ncbi:MAG: hypothetical protein ACR2F2_09815 [Pyrinomonadaceae bacterium]
MKFISLKNQKKLVCLVLVYSFLLTGIFPSFAKAQITSETSPIKNSQTVGADESRDKTGLAETFEVGRDFRVEKFRVAGGSEIITIFANLKNSGDSINAANEVPLVSVLRDTLGDEIPENDRLRYVWMLSYTQPSLGQKIVSGIPFFYRKVSNKGKVGDKPPPPVMDLNPSDKNMWNKIFWVVFKNLILSQFDTLVSSSTLQYRGNKINYQSAAMMRALAVLTLYESLEGEKILNDTELQDIQARVFLSDKFTGSFIESEDLERVYKKNNEKKHGYRGHNWELLRQYSEAQGLYFEPLKMPDGSATHALVMVAESDLKANKNKKFDSRFLNIKNPWKDKRLAKWKGYKEVRWYDAENREVAPETPNAKSKTLIPLALYGLDYPKIPAILIDFRNNDNPRFREVSKRVLDDVVRTLLSISKFGSLPYFFGRYIYDYVTNRRGIDINQASRFQSYSQLKLLLLLDESLDENFRDEISDRLEKVAVNPLENNRDAEIRIARKQYENLIEYAKRPDGLAKKIANDRREEMVRLKHGGKDRMLYAAAHLFSFGLYTHREKPTPELFAEMNVRRRLDFHERILLETARDSARPEIDSDLEAVRKSLAFISEDGAAAQGKTAKAVSKIFLTSKDDEIRQLALSSLDRIKHPAAKKELLALYENKNLEPEWRNLCARYLQLTPVVEPQISATGNK